MGKDSHFLEPKLTHMKNEDVVLSGLQRPLEGCSDA